MDTVQLFHLVIIIIVLIGAINWGMVGAFNMDLVKMATPGNADFEKYIKIAVGLAGIYYAYLVYTWKTQKHTQTTPTMMSS